MNHLFLPRFSPRLNSGEVRFCEEGLNGQHTKFALLLANHQNGWTQCFPLLPEEDAAMHRRRFLAIAASTIAVASLITKSALAANVSLLDGIQDWTSRSFYI